jgi:uncharacterized protein (DUF952 family)
MIYHIVPEPEFLDCFNGDVYIPPSLAACGFVHCALHASVIPVANDFFAGVTDELLVLSIDPKMLDVAVKYEPAAAIENGGVSHLDSATEFPHIYGPVNSRAISCVVSLQKTKQGYRWPVDGPHGN